MRLVRIGVRAISVAAALLVAGSAGLVLLLTFPEPLYAYSAHAGRLSIYSDRPFSEASGQAVLADVERRLATAPAGLTDPNSHYRIFVNNEPWRRRLTFLWNYGAGGVNYFPIAESVFLRQADIDRDRVLRTDGGDVEPPRTLAYYGGHEIGHSLVGRAAGALGNWRLPVWIREGLADFVGFGGDVDIEALTADLRAGDPELDPAASGLYARYRLLVAYMLEREGWSVERLIASNMTQADAERRLLAAIPE